MQAYPGGFQIGGGITAENAKGFLDLGASHVIVTSYVFKDGRINYENLKKLEQTVGKEHLVLDLSCRKQKDDYYIVTDRLSILHICERSAGNSVPEEKTNSGSFPVYCRIQRGSLTLPISSHCL